MPIYAFRCAACAHEFDRLQKLSDPDPESCPACAAGGAVSRRLTAPSFRLAGSGWYETDFKKDGDRKRNLADGGNGGDGGDGGAKPGAEAPAAKVDGGRSDGGPATAPAASKPAAPAPAPATAASRAEAAT